MDRGNNSLEGVQLRQILKLISLKILSLLGQVCTPPPILCNSVILLLHLSKEQEGKIEHISSKF